MTEAQYRALDIDSYSSIKVFIEDRKKYYRKFVLKEPVIEKETDSLRFGSLVDCLLFSPGEFDNRFAVSITDVPKGQYKKLVDELMIVTVGSLNPEGEVTRELEDMLEEAYNNIKFDRNGVMVDFKRDSFDTVKRKFIGSDLEIYYRQKREAYGKQVIEPLEVENALKIIGELKTNPITTNIMGIETEGEIEVFDQFPIIGDLNTLVGEEFKAKCLIDRLIINHEEKVISIYDLKTVWDNEGEFFNNYFYYKYYLQAALYYYLVTVWAASKDHYKGYEVRYTAFITAESSNYKSPLIYKTGRQNFLQGMKGFDLKGKHYQGVIEAAKDILWHKETGIWNISKENYENNGIVEIKPFE